MKKHHTGSIRAHQHMPVPKGRDPHADPMHHQTNRQHGMPLGMHPQIDPDGGEETEGLTGGNQECCE